MSKQKAPQFSETISDFCQMLEEAQKDYSWNFDEVGRMDRLTQDYLHKLELDGLDYKERAAARPAGNARTPSRSWSRWCSSWILTKGRTFSTWSGKRSARPVRSKSEWKPGHTYREF